MDDSFLWWRDGIIYQIYPRSFADSNNDGFGDLPGMIAHLDYLADLGVDALWLSPIYPSPDADFGYDISDYCSIDPRYGTLDDFDRLVRQAHERGIHIIMDLVVNHTSDQHPWFLESKSSLDNPHRDWYIWKDPKPGNRPPNNWQSVFGGGGWEPDPATGQSYFHMFVKGQPDLNWRNPSVRKAILDSVRFWLDRGVDGFRLDVFNAYFKDAGFKDNPPALGIRGFEQEKHVYDIDQPEMMPLLAELRSILDQYPQRYAVGETFLATPEKAASYVGENALHAAFDFTFLEAGWNPAKILKTIQRWESALGPDKWPNYVLNNHDVPRIATRCHFDESDARGKVAAALLLTLRGTPFMYAGEEIGMRDISLRRSEILDPPGKHYWPFYKGRDGCRSPMQWDDKPYGGFSAHQPWLPVHHSYPYRNVKAQQVQEDSLLNFYRRLIELRKTTPALRSGTFRVLPQASKDLLVYVRQDPSATMLILLNFSNTHQNALLPPDLAADWKLHISSRRRAMASVTDSLVLLSNEAIILEKG
jgi:alpha-glucosidase